MRTISDLEQAETLDRAVTFGQRVTWSLPSSSSTSCRFSSVPACGLSLHVTG